MKAYLYCTKAKPDLEALNGFVCFECEINKVEEIIHAKPYTTYEHTYTSTLHECDLCERSCLTAGEIEDYYPRYALYLENVKKIDKPFTVNTAPQNMCYMNMNGERCVLISIQPQHLANIAKGLKDIEVRKSILNELKGLIKLPTIKGEKHKRYL